MFLLTTRTVRECAVVMSEESFKFGLVSCDVKRCIYGEATDGPSRV